VLAASRWHVKVVTSSYAWFMKSLQERFAFATRDLDRNVTYLAGVSGGRDSVVLLHLLQQGGFTKLTLCHLDHSTRSASKKDLQFVQQLANLSHLRVIHDTLAKSPDSKSLEAKLRKKRQEFFARCTLETEAAGVFLGHHADDVAETFLWNLLRGSGTSGLGGLSPKKEIQTEDGPILLLRPMLDIWRSEIDDYVRIHSLPFVEDDSNRSRRFTRNRLRHDILPWLEGKLGRNVRQNLHRTAAILAEENRFFENLIGPRDGEAPLSVSSLKEQPIALQRRIILSWLQHHHVAEAGFDEVELVRSLLKTGAGPARVNLSQNRQARRCAGKITLALQGD
jgi:tRNA(Ile)-lysidine synthase